MFCCKTPHEKKKKNKSWDISLRFLDKQLDYTVYRSYAHACWSTDALTQNSEGVEGLWEEPAS